MKNSGKFYAFSLLLVVIALSSCSSTFTYAGDESATLWVKIYRIEGLDLIEGPFLEL